MPGPLDPPAGPDDHVSGPAEAPLVLTMYSDFECPFCQAAQSIVARVRKRMGDELRFVYRHFPIDSHHPLAREAGEMSEAAAAQGAFWPVHDALYDLRGALQRPAMLRVAKQLGLDVARIERELDAHVHAAEVEAGYQSGLRSGVTGTPAFFAGAQPVEGAFDAGSLVEALRAGRS